MWPFKKREESTEVESGKKVGRIRGDPYIEVIQ